MRIDKIKRIWPDLLPKVVRLAKYMAHEYRYDDWVDEQDLIHQAFLALATLKPKKNQDYTHSYILQRMKFRLINYLVSEKAKAHEQLPFESFEENGYIFPKYK